MMHMHTPPKSFHPSVDKTYTTGKEEKLGEYVKEEMGIPKQDRKKGRNTHYKDHREKTKRWWYINSRNKTPHQTKPIIPTTYTPCNIKKKKRQTKTM